MLTLLVDAEVYAPRPLGRQTVVVCAGCIVHLAPDPSRLPADLPHEVVDLDGLRLVPGLIDGHAHLTGGGGEAGYASRVPPLALSRFTRAGVTTVVGVLGTDDLVRTPGELIATARGLCEEGLTAYCHTGGYHLPPATLTGSVRGDIVHVDRVLGLGELALSDHRSSQPTLDELLRLGSEVHVAGLMTGKAGIVHLHLGDGERGLVLVRRALDGCELPARVWNPTHVNRRRALWEEACELAARGCTIDVTAFPPDAAAAADSDELSAAAALGAYLDSGLPSERITVSSDGGGCLPSFDAEGRVVRFDVGDPATLAATLRELLDAGVPLERALPPFTRNVADLLRLPAKGRIEVGADADLVALDASGRVRHVMAGGVWQVRDGETTRRGRFEPG
ncbi:MAG TPA: beta-aspartyl-peptidase [Thermoanaerobaculia bacterium]|nr:beta-aspartyl-peptidase [Thermoanaerobaculia bacterium]